MREREEETRMAEKARSLDLKYTKGRQMLGPKLNEKTQCNNQHVFY